MIIPLAFLLLLISCNGEPVTPPEDQPGRRDYEWTVDTLSNIAPYNSYLYIWGSSPADVWVAGHGDFDKALLHYDGSTWAQPPNLPLYPGIDAWSIAGSSNNDFWIGGSGGYLWHYVDNNFNRYGPYMQEGYRDLTIAKFFINNKNNIYACGSTYKTSDDKIYAILMKFNGSFWEHVIVPEIEGVHFLDIKRSHLNNNFYLLGVKPETAAGDSFYIFEYDRKTINQIQYEVNQISDIPGLFSTNKDLLFAFNKKLYRFNNKKFFEYKDLSIYVIRTMTNIIGRSESDFFINMTDGIGHYNGTDLITIYNLNDNSVFTDAMIFEKDVFFTIYNPRTNTSLVIHGKFK